MKNQILPFAKQSQIRERIVDSAVQIYGESALESGNLGFIHSLHANCYLPRKNSKELQYVHQNGHYSILLQAGSVLNPSTQEWEQQPLPYGGKPRALLSYISTFAVKNNTAVVPIGNSFTDFVRNMSRSATGGARGTIAPWKKQILALSASTLRIGGSIDGKHAKTRKIDIAQEIDVWFAKEPNQLSLFPSELVLTSDYLEALKEHAMPVDMRALYALQNDPFAFDVYTWLTYRLPRVRQKNGVLIPWTALYAQFGGGYSDIYNFKNRFCKSLSKVKTLYDAAKFSWDKSGFRIYCSPPAISSKNTIVKLR